MATRAARIDALVDLLPGDPRPWILESDEPAARWVTLTGVLGRAVDHAEVRTAHADVLADAGTQELLVRLGDWEDPGEVGGHNSPRYAPNLLVLLHEMGLRAGDDGRVEALLDAMLRHRTGDGRFASFARWRKMPEPVWSSLPCDHHAITEALLRHGRGGDARVAAALEVVAAEITQTSQGRGWLCRADPAVGFRGPGRKTDVCLQVTLEALRAFSWVPAAGLPGGITRGDLHAAGRTCLRAWRERGAEKPYLFGHGVQFKTVKWPATWYGALLVLDTLGRYPDLWRAAPASSADGPTPGGEAAAHGRGDRRALAEIAACLIAYNLDDAGRVTPLSCYRGFESFSWGQKKRPSPFATARLLAALAPFAELAGEIAAVDVMALGSSKGGRGTPRPPKTRR